MANRRHIDSKRMPVRVKRRTSKIQSSPADRNDGASNDTAPSPEALADDAFDDAGDAAADIDFDVDSDSDFDERNDTGRGAERLAAGDELDEELSEELGVDNIVGPLEAGLGGGLDQAEEARAGITDEEIAKKTRRR